MRFVYASLGLLCVALAGLGALLPLLPTVPFLLLATFFFARSSERLHAWLLNHKSFGPMIQDWNERGVIRTGAKKAATYSVAAVFLLSFLLGAPLKVIVIQAFTLSCVMLFIWTRPSG